MSKGMIGIRRKKNIVRFLIMVLTITMMLPMGGLIMPIRANAAVKTLTLKAAKASAVATSDKIEQVEMKLETKYTSLEQAYKSIAEKQRNMSTFRWSPLLSFKFPSKPDLAEAYEFRFKPLSIKAQIDSLNHQLTDQKLAEYETVNSLYVKIVGSQKKIEYYEERQKQLALSLEKNRARVGTGEASAADVEKMEKALTAMKNKLTGEKRTLSSSLRKLSKAVGFDVSVGYRFVNPFVEAEINRSNLQSLIDYGMDRDQTVYDARLTATTSRISVRTNYDLMSGQYGGYMGYISSYVQQALRGEKIDKKAFKKRYAEFLTAIDARWQGSIRIIFFKFPREWFKGSLDGIRYVEDEPYALMEASLQYADDLKSQKSAEDDLKEKITDAFENYISAKNTYEATQKQVRTEEANIKKLEVQNRLGEISYEEYKEALDSLEELQEALFADLASYSESLYALDRVTCGGVSAILSGTDAEVGTAGAGESFAKENESNLIHYTINSIVSTEEFELSLSVPEEFTPKVTHFELWCNGTKIGNKTAIDSKIRHLGLAIEAVDEAKIRFYDEEKIVSDVTFDASMYSGTLRLSTYSVETMENDVLGRYTLEQNDTTGLITIRFTMEAGNDISKYLIQTTDGKNVLTDTPMGIDKEFRYLSEITSGVDQLQIRFYNDAGEEVYLAHFTTSDQTIRKTATP